MAAKLCKELQILLGNNTKYSDFIGGKYRRAACIIEGRAVKSDELSTTTILAGPIWKRALTF